MRDGERDDAKAGRLIIEETVDLPEGAEVDLTIVDPGDARRRGA